ncbi:MAG: phytanoyl-CoA dioxygenase family protein [Pseudomonas farsensis]|uniref:phytanoyl-CoA dioxygenase family protein n=1 Tax=Pseudomonas farsensis TaxID=2745492 RepID=UPI003C7AC96E
MTSNLAGKLIFHAQRSIRSLKVRECLANLSTRRLPAPARPLTDPASEVIDRLRHEGIAFLPNLPSQLQIDDILSYIEDKQVRNPYKPAQAFPHQTPPNDCHTAHFSAQDILSAPHLLAFANDPQVLEIVSHFLGAKPTISNIGLWWSYPGHDTPEQAQFFHRDVDDLRFIKLFVYLTDVDESAGPHAFVPGSQNSSAFSKLKRYSDDEVTQHFGSDSIHYITGAKGSSFLENTFGLHKGRMPTQKPRLAFQVQYSLHPITAYRYTPQQRAASHAQHDRYINRLYLQP